MSTKKLQLLGDFPTSEATTEQIVAAVQEYLEENPVSPGATTEQVAQIEANKEAIEKMKFETDETLTLKDGVLSVNTAVEVNQDNTLPITSAAVHAAIGNIEVLLGTI